MTDHPHKDSSITESCAPFRPEPCITVSGLITVVLWMVPRTNGVTPLPPLSHGSLEDVEYLPTVEDVACSAGHRYHVEPGAGSLGMFYACDLPRLSFCFSLILQTYTTRMSAQPLSEQPTANNELAVEAPAGDSAIRRAAFANPEFVNLSFEAKAATDKERSMTLLQGIKLYPKAVGWSMLLSTCIIMEGYDLVLLGRFVPNHNAHWQPVFCPTKRLTSQKVSMHSLSLRTSTGSRSQTAKTKFPRAGNQASAMVSKLARSLDWPFVVLFPSGWDTGEL